MKRQFLLLLILGFSLSGFAQQRTSNLRATIIDNADGSPMPGAVVLVDSTYHGIADAQGRITINNIPRGEQDVNISFLGYETIIRKENFNQATVNLGTIRMAETGLLMEGVVVTAVSTMAVIKGDTTQYNAAAFKTNPDADAGDLISKLPGVTVEDGTVTIQGETVSRAYVDGKLFFGDDVMSALNNLPADALEGIQFFDELTDEAKFIGFDDGNRQRALNLVTKHKVNRSTTGRIEAGYGMELDKNAQGDYEDRYIVSGNINTFTDKNRWSLNGSFNNMNRANRGEGYSGGGGGGFGGGGLRTINSIGLNYNGTWNPKMQLNASYSYNQNQNKTDSWEEREYATVDRIQRDTTSSRSTNNTHQGNLRYEYTGSKDRIFFNASGSYRKNDSWSDNWSDNTLAGVLSRSQTSQSSFGDNYSINGNLMWTHKLGEKAGRTITFGVNGRLNESDSESDREVLRELSSFSHSYTISNTSGNSIGGRISYAEPLSDKSRLMLSYRLSRDHSESIVEAWDQLNNQLDTALSNTFTRNELDHTMGLNYSYSDDKFRISGGLDYEISELERLEYFPGNYDYNRSFNTWEPNASIRYTLDRSRYFELRYDGSANLPSIEQLQNVITEGSSGTSLSAGNPKLKESYTHSLNLRYNTANTEKSTNFFLQLSARLSNNSISNRTYYYDEDTVLPQYSNYVAMAGSRLVVPENLNGARSISTMGGFSFPIRSLGINVNLGGGYNYQRSPSYTNVSTTDETTGVTTREEFLNYANTHGGNFMVGFVSNISQNVDFSIHSMTGISYTHNSAVENRKTWNENVTVRGNFIFLGGFTGNTDLSWRYQYSDQTTSTGSSTTNSFIWNVGFGRKFFRRQQGELRVTFYDILNQSQKAPRTSYNGSENYFSTSWTRSMGRYVMASFSYRFNSMNSLSRGAQGGDGQRMREYRGGEGGPPAGGPPGGGMMGPGGGGGRGGF